MPPPRKEPKMSMNFTHPDDELGLYTAAEESDFDHIAGLKGYTNLVTSSIVHAVCRGDDKCDLNELPGGPSYSLTKLENEFQDMTQMGGFEYFMKKFCEPVLQVLHYVAATGGFVTACQWMFWLLCIIKRTLSAFCKPPMPVPTDNKLRADVLLELLGDTRPEPYRQTSAAHRRGLHMLESDSPARKTEKDHVRSWNLCSVHRFQDQVEDVSIHVYICSELGAEGRCFIPSTISFRKYAFSNGKYLT